MAERLSKYWCACKVYTAEQVCSQQAGLCSAGNQCVLVCMQKTTPLNIPVFQVAVPCAAERVSEYCFVYKEQYY